MIYNVLLHAAPVLVSLGFILVWKIVETIRGVRR